MGKRQSIAIYDAFARLSGWLLVSVVVVGCGKSDEFAEARRTSSKSYEEGAAAFSSRDFPKAIESLSGAIQSGGLNADLYSSAAVQLAVAYAATRRFEEANLLLSELEAGAPNRDEVFAARSYVLAKQGKLAESRTALAKARQYNRAVQEFKD
ncbi:MAG: hypothetical protein JNL18_25300 [Planctomycetaceae bacterium]|nr:hypothetical protein [Planctomycetaceae bacterium]